MSGEEFFAAVERVVEEGFPLRHDGQASPIKYGTSGFRTVCDLLPPIAARVAPIVLLYIWSQNGHESEARVIARLPCRGAGMIITASHNPPADNGLKLIGSDGAMLAAQWEAWCFRAANASSGRDVVDVLRLCASETGIAAPPRTVIERTVVHLGRDTRPSGTAILQAVKQVLLACGCSSFVDHGVITTPQMHYIVWRSNSSSSTQECASVNEQLYYSEICIAFSNLVRPFLQGSPSRGEDAPAGLKRSIVVDASNGVGALGLKKLLASSAERRVGDEVNSLLTAMFDVRVINDQTDTPGALNKDCGADHAKVTAQPGAAMRELVRLGVADAKTHFYCLDGDADRLAAFSVDVNGQEASWHLIDGDRFSILFAMLCHHWLGSEAMGKLDVGVVMTGYTNGAARQFIEDSLHMRTFTAATGVKNLHPVAHARDIGIYFESNGHGTVLINEDKCESALRAASVEGVDDILASIQNARALLSQVCGDAIGDMLMCEVALLALNLSFGDVCKIYADRPVLQTKVTVRFPQRITTTPDETRALTPVGLQEEIDRAVALAMSPGGPAPSALSARAFVRASGTEPIVRVFAEASDPDVCEVLSRKVTEAVVKYCNVQHSELI